MKKCSLKCFTLVGMSFKIVEIMSQRKQTINSHRVENILDLEKIKKQRHYRLPPLIFTPVFKTFNKWRTH